MVLLGALTWASQGDSNLNFIDAETKEPAEAPITMGFTVFFIDFCCPKYEGLEAAAATGFARRACRRGYSSAAPSSRLTAHIPANGLDAEQ
eukprot:5579044-Amphidinium_carterae.1